MASRSFKPFEHDCDGCWPVGWVCEDRRTAYNLYICMNKDGGGTVLLRYGNEGHEYKSYPFSKGGDSRGMGSIGMNDAIPIPENVLLNEIKQGGDRA